MLDTLNMSFYTRVLSGIDIGLIRESRYSLRLSIFYFPQEEAQSNSVPLKRDSGKDSLWFIFRLSAVTNLKKKLALSKWMLSEINV